MCGNKVTWKIFGNWFVKKCISMWSIVFPYTRHERLCFHLVEMPKCLLCNPDYEYAIALNLYMNIILVVSSTKSLYFNLFAHINWFSTYTRTGKTIRMEHRITEWKLLLRNSYIFEEEKKSCTQHRYVCAWKLYLWYGFFLKSDCPYTVSHVIFVLLCSMLHVWQ